MKQTSIEWLQEKLDGYDFNNHHMEVNIVISLPKYVEILNQAKAMEKEQHEETFSKGWTTRERFDDLVPDIIYPEGLDYEEKQEYAFEQYYNETYKK
jgi:hypothetical protein